MPQNSVTQELGEDILDLPQASISYHCFVIRINMQLGLRMAKEPKWCLT